MKKVCRRGSSTAKVVLGMKDLSIGKLASNWEGSYRVTIVAGVGAYYLKDMEERPLP